MGRVGRSAPRGKPGDATRGAVVEIHPPVELRQQCARQDRDCRDAGRVVTAALPVEPSRDREVPLVLVDEVGVQPAVMQPSTILFVTGAQVRALSVLSVVLGLVVFFVVTVATL